MIRALEQCERACIYTHCNFHTDDCTVLDNDMLEQYINEGADFLYTEYDGEGHNVWILAYEEPLLRPWVYSKQKTAAWFEVEQIFNRGISILMSEDSVITNEEQEISVSLDISPEANSFFDNIIFDFRLVGSSQIQFHEIQSGHYEITHTINPSDNGFYYLPAMVETFSEPGKFYYIGSSVFLVFPKTDMIIFDDHLGEGWILEDRDAFYDTTSTTFVKKGNFSFKIALKRGKNIQYVPANVSNPSLFGYSHLQFYINGGNSSGQDLRITTDMITASYIKLSELGIIPQADTWTKVSIPVSQNGFLDNIMLIGTSTDYDTVYIDDIRLVSEKSEITSINKNQNFDSWESLDYNLSQNYPNPFNPITTIPFEIKKPAQVKIEIYNILGQKVRTLLNRYTVTGAHSVTWDATDNYGNPVNTGIYYYQLKADGVMKRKKMILIK